jgi:hypothetical protein
MNYITTTEHNRLSGTSAQVNLSLPDGSVRLKIDNDGYLHIKSSSKLEIDNQLYELMSDSGKTGPFAPHYHVLYLRRKD